MRQAGPVAPERFEVAVTPPYPVRVGPGVLSGLASLTPGGRVALIADENAGARYGDEAADALAADGRQVLRLRVPSGEDAKRIEVWAELLGRLARAGFARDDAVVALGGGVTCDLAGYVGAAYMRGIAVVHVPTTVLAMADAAIGGKTAVNLPEGKNLVGAFWQPRAVLMDVRTLRSLPPRVFMQGTVEVFKHGLLADPALAEAVVSGALAPDADDAALTRWLAASGRVKAAVVAGDAREDGARAHLNLGHTLGHALEAASGHRLTHGDAVAWGLLYAAYLSPRVLDVDDAEEAQALVRRLIRTVAPAPPPAASWDELAPFLGRDKKTRGGRRHWVLMRAPGRPTLQHGVPEDAERAAWEAFLADPVQAERAAAELPAAKGEA